MLTKEAIKDIEETIGYTFKSKALLEQAFTRSSYAEEDRMHGGKGLSNEQLEFFGDSVLNYVIVSELARLEAHADKDGNIISRSEKELSNFVTYWSNKEMLAFRMNQFRLSKYLLLSKGDQMQNVDENKSAKEDLFEAIIGAIWFDSNRNLELIRDILYNQMGMDFYEECFEDYDSSKQKEFIKYYNEEVIPSITRDDSDKNGNFDVEMEDDEDGITVVTRISKDLNGFVGKMMAGNKHTDYLTDNAVLKLKKKIDPETVTEANSIQKLKQLFQLKIIKVMPIQEEEYDYENGLWMAKVELGDGSTFLSTKKYKQDAKNEAALEAFKYAYDRAGNATKDGKLIEL